MVVVDVSAKLDEKDCAIVLVTVWDDVVVCEPDTDAPIPKRLNPPPAVKPFETVLVAVCPHVDPTVVPCDEDTPTVTVRVNDCVPPVLEYGRSAQYACGALPHTAHDVSEADSYGTSL